MYVSLFVTSLPIGCGLAAKQAEAHNIELIDALQGKLATVMRRTIKSGGASKGAASKGGAAPTDITYYGPGTQCVHDPTRRSHDCTAAIVIQDLAALSRP